MQDRRLERPPRDISIAFIAFVAVCLAAAIYFMAAPVEPFGFFKDLGFNWEVIDWSTHLIHSPIDAIDSAGWSPWFLGPTYFLNSYLGDVPGIVVAAVVGNALLAVKIIEVVQTFAAAAGAYALYATSSRSVTWRIMFAIGYATLPETALTIRWNADFGWIVALAPGCLAFTKLLLNRCGARALPFAGIVSAIGGYLFAIQFFLFTSLPLLALAAATTRHAPRDRRPGLYIAIGLVSCVSSGAFFVLPSFISPLVSDSAQRNVSLASGAFLSNYSLDWMGLLTLVEREWAASPIPDYNVSSALPWLIIPSLILWSSALSHLIVTRERKNTFCDPLSIAVVLVCVVLSLGTTLPFGEGLWKWLYVIPHVNGVRTVDRFFTLVPMMILYWATCRFEAITRQAPRVFRITAYMALIICVVDGGFDRAQHSWSLDYSEGVHEPELNAVRRVVVGDGVPVASFASVNGGSAEDAPTYGRPEPVSWATTDLGSRFITDGVGASGALGRAGVGDVVSSPSWTYDAPGRPNVSNIYRTLPNASIAFSSPEDVLVSRIPRRPDVSATSLVCVQGGPGPFDLLYADTAFSNYSFVSESNLCRENGFIDAAPADDWRSDAPIDAWSGRKLSTSGLPLLDVDYSLLYNRTLLNIPWYRNAVDGERPVFDSSGAIRFLYSENMTIPDHHLWPAHSTFYLRIDAHDPALITLRGNGHVLGLVRVSRRLGFHWVTIHIPADVASSEHATLEVTPDLAQQRGDSWPGVVLDGVAVLEGRVDPARSRPTRFVVASLATFDTVRSVSGSLDGGAPNGDDSLLRPISNGASLVLRNVSGSPAYVATRQRSVIRFRWTGQSGLVAIAVTAMLNDESTALSLSTATNACCETYAQTAPGASTELAVERPLHTGQLIEITIASTSFERSHGDRITSVRARAVQPLAITAPQAERSSAELNFAMPLEALSHLREASGLVFTPEGARGTGRSFVQAEIVPVGSSATLHVRVGMHATAYPANSYAMLKCGASRDSLPLADVVDLRVGNAGGNTCKLILTWRGEAVLNLIQADCAGGDEFAAARTNLWIPAGKYTLHVRRDDGTDSNPRIVTIDGCHVALCKFAYARMHLVTIHERSPNDSLLILESTRPAAKPRPVTFTRTSILRWQLTVSAPTDIAFTQLFDGNWALAGSGYRSSGAACDITDTCFSDVPAGTYTLSHRWPMQLTAGFAITILTLVGASLLLSGRVRSNVNVD